MNRPGSSQPLAARWPDVARGIVGLLGLLLVLVGVPAVLWWAVGWPLPHELPSWSSMRTALQGPLLLDVLVLNALAILGWWLWVQAAVQILAELAAARRGRLATRVPLVPALTHEMAARLVGAALLLSSATMTHARPGTIGPQHAPAPSVHPEPVTTMLRTPAQASGWPTDASSPATAPAAAAGGRPHIAVAASVDGRPIKQTEHAYLPRYVVQRGDTLWDLAARHLPPADGQIPGQRWTELHRLNRAQPQSDGRRLLDSDLILPGWILRFPADASGLPPRDPPGEGPSGGRQLDPPSGAAPPGSPAAPTTGSTTPRPPSTTTPPAASSTRPAGTPSSVPPDAPPSSGATAGPRPSTPSATIPALLGVGAVLAAGVAGLLGARRRRQQRHRPTGQRIPLPTGRPAELEGALTQTASTNLPARIALAVRALVAAARHHDQTLPPITTVTATAQHLEIGLAAPAGFDPPIESMTVQGSTWQVPATIPDASLAALAADTLGPTPALLTLGEDADDRLVLVNPEAGGLLLLHGDLSVSRRALAAMAVELATTHQFGPADLLLIGVGVELPRLAGLHNRVRVARSLDDVLGELEAQAAASADLLRSCAQPTVVAARGHRDQPGAWTPTILLCAEPPDTDTLTRLAAATTPTSTVTAIICTGTALGTPPPAGAWPVTITEHWATLATLGLHVRLQQLTDQQYADLLHLLEIAADPQPVAPGTPPYDQAQRPPTAPVAVPEAARGTDPDESPGTNQPRTPSHHSTASQPPSMAGAPGQQSRVPAGHRDRLPGASDTSVTVQVLGPPRIHGLTRPLERGKAVELIVYLALHPRGANADQVWEALWPHRPRNNSTLHTTVSHARTALGPGPDGMPWLADARDGLYRLGPLSVDVHQFETLASGAEPSPAGDEALRAALDLVRGEPLYWIRPHGYDWAVVHRVELAAQIGDTAERLAHRRLAANDPAGATWAARRGLIGAPMDERLYRILMQAADAAGNPTGVDAVFDELLHLLAADDDSIDPIDELHPETLALYQQLRPRTSKPRKRAG